MLSLALPGWVVPWRAWGYGAVVAPPFAALFYHFGIWALRPYLGIHHITFNNLIRRRGRGAGGDPGPPGDGVIGLARWRQSGQDWLAPIWAVANGLARCMCRCLCRALAGVGGPAGRWRPISGSCGCLPLAGESTRFFQRFSLTPTPYASLRRVFCC